MGNQGSHFQRAGKLLIYLGMLILIIWVGVLATAFVFRFLLGLYVPEYLTSVNFSVSGTGYGCLLINIIYPIKMRDRLWRSRLILSLAIGIVLIINGVHGIMHLEPDIFSYLCLFIGAIIIIFGTKTIMKV